MSDPERRKAARAPGPHEKGAYYYIKYTDNCILYKFIVLDKEILFI